MILKNPIISSGLIVYSFWYILLYIAFAIVGHYGPWWVFEDYPLSLAAITLGAAVGVASTAGVRAARMHNLESSIRNGHAMRGARLTMGKLPEPEPPARDTSPSSYMAVIRRRKWWGAVARDFPAHARAFEAITAVMASRPALPASPVSGGHAGRTLFAHSVAVTDAMFKMARAWRYTGQKNRNGKVRVPLRDTKGSYHAFQHGDTGLLALTAFAHDIGKIACYQPTGKRDGKLERVREALPNHDTEGARMLRSMPEVMELPYADRRALLVAVGHYHHAGSMSNSDGITDRMRSLTELLIAADQATGKSEGESVDAAYTAEGEDELVPADMVSMDAVTGAQGADSAAKESPAKLAINAAPAQERPVDRTTMDGRPFELSLLFQILADDSVIGGKVKGDRNRVGVKSDNKLWLSPDVITGKVAEMTSMGPIEQAEELLGADTGPKKAVPFIERLLVQLHEQGKLMVEWKGRQLDPRYALFDAYAPSIGRKYSKLFIVDADILASTSRLPEDAKMVIDKPSFGVHLAEAAVDAAAANEHEQGQVNNKTEVAPPEEDEATAKAAALFGGDDETGAVEDDEPGETLEDACRLILEIFPEAVRIGAGEGGRKIGTIKGDTHPGALAAFMEAMDALDTKGVDTSKAERFADKAGVLRMVQFPIPDQE